MIQANITLVVASLTLFSNIAFVVFLSIMAFQKDFRLWVYNIVNNYVLHILFVISMSALVGSLAYSNIAGFPPCELCWIARIFMYPQAIITFMAIIWKDKKMVSYLLPLTILGTIVTFYHSLTNWSIGTSLVGCASAGGECARVYVFEYGYITIPFMALSTFVYLLTVSVIYYLSNNDRI